MKWRGREASDWFSPMLVREMRRGTRSRAFVSAFLGLQLVLVCAMLVALLPDARQSSELSGYLFWGAANVWFLLVMPLRGMTMVTSEMREGGFDLVSLTRVTAWRIVAGKWASAVTESLLVVTALLPYVMLRYFIGGVDVASETAALLALLAGSLVLTAVTILGGVYPSILVRAGAAGLCFLIYTGGYAAMSLRGVRRFFQTPLQLSMLAISLTLVTLFVLELAASRIAPLAENHALRKRSFALVLLGVSALGNALGLYNPPLLFLTFLLLLYTCIDAFGEPVRSIPGMYAPFASRGIWGRLAGRVFYPGWPSGFVFTLLAIPGMVGTALLAFLPPERLAGFLTTLAACILVPAALGRICTPNSERVWAWFLGFHAACLVVLAAVVTGVASVGGEVENLVALFPSAALLMVVVGETPDGFENAGVLVHLGLAALATCILLLSSSRAWQRIGLLERQAGRRVAVAEE